MMNHTNLPNFLSPFFWSYDLSQLHLERNKKRIITNILNYGTKEATDWLFSTFKKEDIEEAIKIPLSGEWNRKSLNFWSLVLGVSAGNISRQIS